LASARVCLCRLDRLLPVSFCFSSCLIVRFLFIFALLFLAFSSAVGDGGPVNNHTFIRCRAPHTASTNYRVRVFVAGEGSTEVPAVQHAANPGAAFSAFPLRIPTDGGRSLLPLPSPLPPGSIYLSVTIFGENFGPSTEPLTVTIGGQFCNSTRHINDSVVICDNPPAGFGFAGVGLCVQNVRLSFLCLPVCAPLPSSPSLYSPLLSAVSFFFFSSFCSPHSPAHR
jgi:hypothetical protein